uniref:Uncharacterized protein n=1 Tax=Octopus bimaculoides TaxID=37653 RepID=A0A0L8HG61_OCTBM
MGNKPITICLSVCLSCKPCPASELTTHQRSSLHNLTPTSQCPMLWWWWWWCW